MPHYAHVGTALVRGDSRAPELAAAADRLVINGTQRDELVAQSIGAKTGPELAYAAQSAP